MSLFSQAFIHNGALFLVLGIILVLLSPSNNLPMCVKHSQFSCIMSHTNPEDILVARKLKHFLSSIICSALKIRSFTAFKSS